MDRAMQKIRGSVGGDRKEVRSEVWTIENLFLETRLDLIESGWDGLDLNGHGRKDSSEKSIARRLTFSLFHSFPPFSPRTLCLLRIWYGHDAM